MVFHNKIFTRSFLTILFCLTCLFCFPQQNRIDSLEAVLKNTSSDSIKIKVLNTLCKELASGNPSKALECGEKAFLLAQKTENKKSMANAINLIGVVYNIQSDYEKALECYTRSFVLHKEAGNYKGMAYVLNNMGNIYYDQADYPEALDYYLKSLTIHELIKNDIGIASAATNAGLVFFEQKNFSGALENFIKALVITKKTSDKQSACTIMNNIGLIYFNTGDYSTALEYYNNALKIASEVDFKTVVSASFNNIGDVYKKQDDPDKALEYYEKAYEINKSISDKKGIASTYFSMGEAYKNMGDYTNAIACYDSSLAIALEIGDKNIMRSDYENEAEAYAKKGDYENAYACHQKYYNVNDSIFNEKSGEQLLELQTKYETEKKEKEIQLLTNEKERQELILYKNKIILYAFIAGFILVIVMVVIIYRAYRAKRKNLQKEMELNKLKSQFVSTVTHEFRTPISGIKSSAQLLEKYYETWSSDERTTFFSQIDDALDQMKVMLEKVTVIEKDQSGKISFHPKKTHLETYCKQLVSETQALFENEIRINIDVKSEIGEVLADKELLRHMIINLLSNAVKYSPADAAADFIIDKDKDKIIFTIADYGIGIPEEDLKHIYEQFHRGSNVEDIKGTGLGMSIVKRCVDIHKGMIDIKSETGKGTTVTVIIPYMNI
ncbi:MAG: tetratricopeptide repeat-containing sensor histidine kinase [Bacteroidota bacterium]